MRDQTEELQSTRISKSEIVLKLACDGAKSKHCASRSWCFYGNATSNTSSAWVHEIEKEHTLNCGLIVMMSSTRISWDRQAHKHRWCRRALRPKEE